MSTMYTSGQWRKLKTEYGELLGQRNQLLAAAKRVVAWETGPDSDLDDWQRCIRELQAAISRTEGRE